MTCLQKTYTVYWLMGTWFQINRLHTIRIYFILYNSLFSVEAIWRQIGSSSWPSGLRHHSFLTHERIQKKRENVCILLILYMLYVSRSWIMDTLSIRHEHDMVSIHVCICIHDIYLQGAFSCPITFREEFATSWRSYFVSIILNVTWNIGKNK